jgi:hypothetical protein
MLVVIRDGKELSLKASFVVQLFRLSANGRLLYVIRNREEKFKEKWGYNQIELATSTTGILLYFFLMMLKSPLDLHDGILRRLFHRPKEHLLFNEGFLSVLSEVLYQYFATSARTEGILRVMSKLTSPKIFLVDEFLSINTFKLKRLKQLGSIIYISQDLACQRYGYGDNFIAKDLMYKLERDAIALADVVIACSERDRLKYVEMGARKTVFYPNIYPIAEFEPSDKDQTPSISIVLRGRWGPRASRSLEEIFEALSYIHRKIIVYMIGIEPQLVSRNIELQRFEFIPNKSDYLNILSKSWIGINIGVHMAGSNERKYDYAMAGLVVFSDKLGARGDLLLHEYTYVDGHDLAAKLDQLLECGKEKIFEMGTQNRKHTISLADKQREKILRTIKGIMLRNS